MKRIFSKKSTSLLLPICLVIVSFGFIRSENKPVVVENERSILVYHLKGGLLKNFQLKVPSIHPFQAQVDSIGEYGQSAKVILSEIEKENNTSEKIMWELANSPIIVGKNIEMMMKADFLKDNYSIKRYITFPTQSQLIEVTEEVYNNLENERDFIVEQHLTLNPELLAEATIYSNLSLKMPKGIKAKHIDVTHPESGLLLISNTRKNFFIGYVFDKDSYSGIRFVSASAPIFILEGDGKKRIESNNFISKKYIAFIGKLESDFKEFEQVNNSNGSLFLIANKGKTKFEFDIPSLIETEKIIK